MTHCPKNGPDCTFWIETMKIADAGQTLSEKGGRPMPPLKVALVSQVILLIYFQATMWLPLGAWNGAFDWHGVPPGYTAMGVAQVVFLLGFTKRLRWLMFAGLAFYLLWLGLQLYSWWIPYLFGASEQWKEVYARAFESHLRFLPKVGDHLPPDAMHFMLQALLMMVVITSVIAIRGRSEAAAK